MNTSIRTVHGTTRLVFDTVEGITNTVERMHETIARHPLPFSQQPDKPTRAHGLIASAVYSTIRGVNTALRTGVDRSFELIPGCVEEPHRSSGETKMTAVLNGVFGDHLASTGNPLTTAMTLLTPQQPLILEREALAVSMPQASSHLVILVHGLCQSELCWTRKGAPCMGSRLQEKLGCTPLYLRYNTGRHISTNGQEFAQLLEQLCKAWPVPVESLSLIGHSMGGLVIRSASWYAQRDQSTWLQYLQRVVCLGTPHHGSPVERAGHALDRAMQKIPYTEPLAFGRRRSAGIKDLRHGDLLDEDWQGHHPDRHRPDTRRVVPLLPQVNYYFAAATLGRHQHDPLGHILGDLLVRLDSATGAHKDDLRHLNIKPENCQVFHEKNHLDLLDDERVHRQIIDWFGAE
jgi:pimeloyl-ACP methyl ester carboxylesterase